MQVSDRVKGETVFRPRSACTSANVRQSSAEIIHALKIISIFFLYKCKMKLVSEVSEISEAVALLLLIYCLMYFPFFVGVLRLSLFCYALLCVHSSFAIILKRRRKLVALLLLSYRCIVTINVLWFFLMMLWVGLQCVIVVFPDLTYLLFLLTWCKKDNDSTFLVLKLRLKWCTVILSN